MRNRPFEGSSGFEVITPFRLDDGTVFMVDRGWIAQDSDGRPSEVAAAARPATSRSTARLKAGEERIAGRTSTGVEFATIDLDELAERVGEPTYTGAYGVLVQTGADADEPPLAAARPMRDEGPHLSYALQWFVFALLGFIGLGVGGQPGAQGPRRGIRRRRLDEAGAARADAASARSATRTPTSTTDPRRHEQSLDRRAEVTPAR